jgi:hypothetical protein
MRERATGCQRAAYFRIRVAACSLAQLCFFEYGAGYATSTLAAQRINVWEPVIGSDGEAIKKKMLWMESFLTTDYTEYTDWEEEN